MLYSFATKAFYDLRVRVCLSLIPFVPLWMKDLIVLAHQEDISIVHKYSNYLFFYINLGGSKLIGYDFIWAKLRNEGWTILRNHHNHIVGCGHIDNLFEMTEMVNGTLVVAVNGLRGEDNDIVIACHTFVDSFTDG